MKVCFSFVLLFCISLFASGQVQGISDPEHLIIKSDTILLNNGLVVVAEVIDTLGEMVTVTNPNSRKHKKVEIEKEGIFSIHYAATGKEEIYYSYDTLIGHDFSIPDARKFIEGEQDAQRGFHAIGMSALSFAIGFGSGATLGSIIAFGPPFLFAGITTYPRIKVRHHSVRNKANGKRHY